MSYWAASDVALANLETLERLYRNSAPGAPTATR